MLIYLTAIMAASIVSEHIGIRTWLQAVVSAVMLIGTVILFLLKRETSLCAVGMLTMASVAYVVVVLVGTKQYNFIYAYPILFAAMCYLNEKIIITGNVVVIITTILRMITHFNMDDQSFMFVSILASVLIAVASIRVIVLLNRFNQENMTVITQAAAKQDESNQKMILVADNIMSHFESVMGMMDTLKKSADTSNLAMDNIAGSTESTAASIQEQADNVEKALPWLLRRSDSFPSRRRRLPITLQRSSGN